MGRYFNNTNCFSKRPLEVSHYLSAGGVKGHYEGWPVKNISFFRGTIEKKICLQREEAVKMFRIFFDIDPPPTDK